MYSPNYTGVEDIKSFTPTQLERYRTMLLEKTAKQSAFIYGIMKRPFSALELCCGNCRLLVDLARSGVLTRGVGVDASESRIEFGQRWVDDLDFGEKITVVAGDVLDLEPGYSKEDVAVCITGAFQYFSREAALDVLDTMIGCAPVCILELYNVPKERADMLAINKGHLKTWDVLPPDDPFAYHLDNYRWNADERTMLHEKVFIHRSGRIDDGRSELLHYYSIPEILDMFEDVGYKRVEFRSDWGSSWKDGTLSMIVVGWANG